MASEPRTIETFWSVEEAELARGFLEGEGIACQLEGVATAGNFWHLNNATGGVKLRVAECDAERATALLDSVEHHGGDEGDELPDAETDVTGKSSEPLDRSKNPVDDELNDHERYDLDVDADDHFGLFDKLRSVKTWVRLMLLFLAIVVAMYLVLVVVMVLMMSLGSGRAR